MCFSLRTTPGGDNRLLVGMLKEADHVDVGAVPHGQINHQQLRVDVPGFLGQGEDGDFQQWKVEKHTLLG